MKELEKRVFSHFLNSRDYNGLPLETLREALCLSQEELIKRITNLIGENKLSLQFGNESENPFIIRFGHYSKEQQIEFLQRDKTQYVCAYPSEQYLKENRDVSDFSNKPYSKRLALGEAQVKPVYFEMDVLERYFNDPRYLFKLGDYSGRISVETEHYETGSFEKKDEVFIKSFGLAYCEKIRTVTVFLSYLSDLTPEHQMHWYSKEKKGNCKMLKEYYDNMVVGTWTSSHSVFSAFIEEQRILNELAELIIGKKLFHQTFENESRPKEFTYFLRPTLSNYEAFIHLLDKMLSENLSKDFFKDQIDLFEIKEVDGYRERISKGTLTLLDEWLKVFYHHPDATVYDPLTRAFKEIRKERQKPAHKISPNQYDEVFFDKQREFMKEAYYMLKRLRIVFSTHPLASSYQVPKWLDQSQIKNF